MGKEMIRTEDCDLLLDALQFFVINRLTNFQTTEAYSSSDQTKLKYNIYRHSRGEEERVTLRTRFNNLLRWEKYIVGMIMEMKFRINKYSQVFNIVGTGYRGMTKFTYVGKSVVFP
jgi:hypothetical protein